MDMVTGQLAADAARIARGSIADVDKRALRHRLSTMLLASDIGAIALAFCAACSLWLGTLDAGEIGPVLSALLPIFLIVAMSREAYAAEVTNNFAKGYLRAFFALTVATGSILLIAFFLKISVEFSRMVIGLGAAGSAATIAATRYLVTQAGRRRMGDSPFATLVITDTPDCSRWPQSFSALSLGLTSRLDNAADAARLGELTQGYDRVIVECAADDRPAWAMALKSLNIQGEILVPELDRLAPLRLTRIEGRSGLLLSTHPLSLSQTILKRTFDLIVVTLSLPVTLPLCLAVALAVKIDSPGPVFFRQQRIGLANRPFMMWKFRSMRVDAADHQASRLTTRHDDRVTRVGAFIRRTSLDELPQLINVMNGTMSIVGPRPHAEKALAGDSLYWEVDRRYWHRHVVKPGLTGLAQVRGHRGATNAHADLTDRLHADLEYAANWTLLRDISILLGTMRVLVHENAY